MPTTAEKPAPSSKARQQQIRRQKQKWQHMGITEIREKIFEMPQN
jgi:hypothetical protein